MIEARSATEMLYSALTVSPGGMAWLDRYEDRLRASRRVAVAVTNWLLDINRALGSPVALARLAHRAAGNTEVVAKAAPVPSGGSSSALESLIANVLILKAGDISPHGVMVALAGAAKQAGLETAGKLGTPETGFKWTDNELEYKRLFIASYNESVKWLQAAAENHVKDIAKILTHAANPVKPLTMPETVKALRVAMPELTRAKALVIAQTETARTYGRVAHETLQRNGITERRWLTASGSPAAVKNPVCIVCIGNAVQGWVPIDKEFASGHKAPPAHPRCRCDVTGNYEGWLPPQTPWPEPEPGVEPPPPPPEGFPWNENQLTKVPMHLEGAHEKVVYQDPDGAKWMFKPDPTPGQAEVAVYKIMAELGLPSPEAWMVTIGGRAGSIQKMFDDVSGKLGVGSLASASADVLQQVQRHHVLDWLVSQHDTNDGALLLGKGGTVYAVDKGQAYKFFGKDKLSWAYSPNPNTLMYRELYENHINGVYKLDKAAIQPILKAVDALDDSKFRAILRPHAEHVKGLGFIADVDEFLDLAVARKHSLPKDFEMLYVQAEAQRARKIGPPKPPKPPKPVPGAKPPPPPAGTVTPIDDAFVADVVKTGWAGKSVLLGGPQLENGNLLAYSLRKQDGTRVLVLEGKVREAHQDALLGRIGVDPASLRSATAVPSIASGAAANDPYWGPMLTLAKHLASHLGPNGDQTLGYDKFANWQALVGGKLDVDTSPMGAHYKKMALDLLGPNYMVPLSNLQFQDQAKAAFALKQKLAPGVLYEAYVPPPPTPTKAAPAAAGPGPITATKEHPSQRERVFTDGELVTSARAGRDQREGGLAYGADLGGGHRLQYIPHVSMNPYSSVGRILVERDRDGSAAQLQEAVESLSRVGIGTRLMDKDDLELLYLHKTASAAGLEYQPTYQSGALGKLNDSMTVPEQSAVLREWWETRLGVPDVRKLPGWDPTPKYQTVLAPRAGATADVAARGGWAYWERFDISAADLNKEMRPHYLYHGITGGQGLPDFFRAAVNNGELLSTEERYRLGVRITGMSSSHDQGTGGASYAFLRIGSGTQTRGQLRFDKSLLRRTDIFAYGADMFGEQHPDRKSTYGRFDIAGWKGMVRNHSNEVGIKGGVSLLDHLQNVQAGYNRTEILTILRDAGIEKLGGRPIEDVIEGY